jgi:hypothetical protein
MPFDLFRHIIGLNPRVRTVDLFNWGEPFLNKDIFAMLALCAKKNIRTVVHTNLSAYGLDVVEQIVQTSPSCLQVSVDGLSQETYASYRVGGDIERVRKNMDQLSRRLRETGKTLRVEWQFLYHRKNMHDIPAARNLASRLGFLFQARPLLVPRSKATEWHDGPHTSEMLFNGRIPVTCPYLWLRLTVDPQGCLTFCCIAYHDDDKLSAPLSSISTPAELLSLLNSPILQRARACFQRDAKYSEIHTPILCEICDVFQRQGGLDSSLHPELEEDISVARKVLIEKTTER